MIDLILTSLSLLFLAVALMPVALAFLIALISLGRYTKDLAQESYGILAKSKKDEDFL